MQIADEPLNRFCSREQSKYKILYMQIANAQKYCLIECQWRNKRRRKKFFQYKYDSFDRTLVVWLYFDGNPKHKDINFIFLLKNNKQFQNDLMLFTIFH